MDSSYFDSNGGVSLKQKLKSASVETKIPTSDNGCFECNICLESAHDPVVTFCGHLYCWPCIYKWLDVQSSSDESDQNQTCPVCKSEISHASLVPLYGRGTSNSESESKKIQKSLGIPHRPPPYNLNAVLTSTRPRLRQPHPGQQLHPSYFQAQSRPFHYEHYIPHLYGSYGTNGLPYLGGAAMTSFFNPVIGMFGEMVLTRIFGVSQANLFAYPHNGSGSPRMRRQEMQIDKSLNRVSIFLLCCILLCLLLF
ncbi:E3 ubiquitin-protein ligase RMA3-like [Abrus precatorius]|uniref:E3 ubiquitin-protein ligase RMA n=1 Tax=Abrus precatorius TaxID=3816 RepID=A0A8B8LLZ5_ABRPR|nr:E3 ubiquitin-protein ligase RMA3-like [Abrus precatorius]XP_027355849.1 E3 ubiquitin-protein ligase RMA3-like [Abrus precatorius]